MTRAAAILISDTTGADYTPTPMLEALAERAQADGASVLLMERCDAPTDERLACLLAALASLRRQGVQRMTLIGWRGGAALALAAASACEAVVGVAALASDADVVILPAETGASTAQALDMLETLVAWNRRMLRNPFKRELIHLPVATVEASPPRERQATQAGELALAGSV